MGRPGAEAHQHPSVLHRDGRQRADHDSAGAAGATCRRGRQAGELASTAMVTTKRPPRSMTPEQELRQDNFINDGIKPSLLELGPVMLAPSTESGKSAGLTFHYSPYGVGPYAEGPYTVFVPWTDFRQYLSPEGVGDLRRHPAKKRRRQMVITPSCSERGLSATGVQAAWRCAFIQASISRSASALAKP